MGNAVSVASPAKINLHLDVGEKREDGYHELKSLFQMVDFGDELTVRSLKEKDVCTISGDFDVEPSCNTIWKAVEQFRKETRIHNGISVEVRKVIPCGSGTGGGSSNAASTLRALDALFGTGLSVSLLSAMGSRIGSDVPFFLSAPAAFVCGRGEVIRPVGSVRSFHGVLVYPAFGISTSLAYGWLDASRIPGTGCSVRQTDPLTPAELIYMYENIDPSHWAFFNSFFPVVSDRYPDLVLIRDKLYELGALFASMSGSGSAIFGLFAEKRAADNAMETFLGNFRKLAVIKLLDSLPFTVLQ